MIQDCAGFCEIEGVLFENVTIAGQHILNDTQWNLQRQGNIISNITYT